MNAIHSCDPDLRGVLMGNVVLTGGGSFFAGFADRLHTELTRQFQIVRTAVLVPVPNVNLPFVMFTG